ncbi:MAG: PAS domain S-box protein [Gaiellaceae bacterium]
MESEPATAGLLAAIVESCDDAIFAKTLDGTILSWNPAAGRLYGYTAAETVGQSVSLLLPEGREHELDELLARIRRGERVEHHETQRRRKDGALVDVSVTISPVHDTDGRIVGASSIARDIRDRKRQEHQRVQANRLESVGALAGGVAHDFNNVLMVIRACAALLLKHLDDPERRRDVMEIDGAAQRGAELTRQLVVFGKQPAREAPHGTETILFVDDEEAVRVIVAETLRSYGYTVVEASSGLEAIRLVAEEGFRPDLLLTDLEMPEMSGRELAGRLLDVRPALAVLTTSGYPAEPGGTAAHVQKPFGSAELAAAVRRALDARAA